MKKSIFSMIIFLMVSFTFPEAKAESQKDFNTRGLKEFLLKTRSNSSLSRQKKKKFKKLVRKAGRVYRIVKPDTENRKKSRKIQRTTRRIIDIF